MKKEKLEAKLENAQIKRNAIFADIESLQSNEREADKEISEIKADLKALDKPELRHGDYGVYKDGSQSWATLEGLKGLEVFGDICGSGEPPSGKEDKLCFGNIFDDLKAISQPLEEFELEQKNNTSINCYGNIGYLFIKQGSHKILIESDRFHDFILNLRRMESTLKGK